MALDAELIERSNQRNEKADNSESNVPNSDYEEGDSASRSGSLRENVQAAKNGVPPQSQGDIRADKKAKSRTQDTKEGVASKGIEMALSPAKKGISSLLKSAWLNLITSWGLTLIWIDIHVFGNQVLGNKLFCDLGEEWVPDVHIGANETAGKIEEPKKAIGLVENMGCCCLNLGCLLLVIMLMSLFAMIAAALSNPLQAGWEIMKVVFQIIKNIFI